MPFFSKLSMQTAVRVGSSGPELSTMSMPDSETDAIRIVTTKDYKAAAACLANAFSKDDVCKYFYACPDTDSWSAERKWKLHEQIMDTMTYAHLKFGAVHAIGDPGKDGSYDAVTLWMPPGTNMDSYLAMIRNGVMRKVLAVTRSLSKEGRIRLFKEFVPLLGSTKAEVLKERDPSSWYLVYLGVHTRARGRGLAKKLVSFVTRQADANDQACYLENSGGAANVPIYRKLGFEICKQIVLHRGAKEIWLDIMVREPTAAATATKGRIEQHVDTIQQRSAIRESMHVRAV